MAAVVAGRPTLMGLASGIAARPIVTRRSLQRLSTARFSRCSPHVMFIAGRNWLSGSCGRFSTDPLIPTNSSTIS
jgi:hypothetical protein